MKGITKAQMELIQDREKSLLGSFGISPMDERSAMQVYSDMFQFGENYIQHQPLNCPYEWDEQTDTWVNVAEPDIDVKDLHPNPLIYIQYYRRDKETGKPLLDKDGEPIPYMVPKVLFEDEDYNGRVLSQAWKSDLAITNGIAFWGKSRSTAKANRLFAFIVDLDGVLDSEPKYLRAFVRETVITKVIPAPNYIIFSGTGLHLYYLLETPVDLYPNIREQMVEFRKFFVRHIWDGYVSNRKIQVETFIQGFRVIGGQTKIPGKKVRAYAYRQDKWDFMELWNYVASKHPKGAVPVVDLQDHRRKSKCTLAEAKEQWPEWYERRIVKGEPPRAYVVPRGLYDWWKEKAAHEATFGHRYYCVMTLAIFAIKCDVPFEELKKDAEELRQAITDRGPDPLRKSDIKAALRCYTEEYKRFPRRAIQSLTQIHMDKKERKPSLPREVHLQLAREKKETIKKYGRMKNPEGRPPKEQIVREWQEKHPNGRKIDCERDTGLSRHTVLKWWEVS